MSSEPENSREWRFYVTDMIEFVEKVLSYTSGMDQATFVADTLTYDAALRNLELIGEAATHIPIDIRTAHPEIQWRNNIGARNRLAHGYLSIDDEVYEVDPLECPKCSHTMRLIALIDDTTVIPPHPQTPAPVRPET